MPPKKKKSAASAKSKKSSGSSTKSSKSSASSKKASSSKKVASVKKEPKSAKEEKPSKAQSSGSSKTPKFESSTKINLSKKAEAAVATIKREVVSPVKKGATHLADEASVAVKEGLASILNDTRPVQNEQTGQLELFGQSVKAEFMDGWKQAAASQKEEQAKFEKTVVDSVEKNLMSDPKSPFFKLGQIVRQPETSKQDIKKELDELKRKLTRSDTTSYSNMIVRNTVNIRRASAGAAEQVSQNVRNMFDQEHINSFVQERNLGRCVFQFKFSKTKPEELLENHPFRIVTVFLDDERDACYDIMEIGPDVSAAYENGASEMLNKWDVGGIQPVFSKVQMAYIQEWYVAYSTYIEYLRIHPLGRDDMAQALALGREMYEDDVSQLSPAMIDMVKEHASESYASRLWNWGKGVLRGTARWFAYWFTPSNMLKWMQVATLLRVFVCCIVAFSFNGWGGLVDMGVQQVAYHFSMFATPFFTALEKIVGIIASFVGSGIMNAIGYIKSILDLVASLCAGGNTLFALFGKLVWGILGLVTAGIPLYLSKTSPIEAAKKAIKAPWTFNKWLHKVIAAGLAYTMFGFAAPYIAVTLPALVGVEVVRQVLPKLLNLFGVGDALSNYFSDVMLKIKGNGDNYNLQNVWYDPALVTTMFLTAILPKICTPLSGMTRKACDVVVRGLQWILRSASTVSIVGWLLLDMSMIFCYKWAPGMYETLDYYSGGRSCMSKARAVYSAAAESKTKGTDSSVQKPIDTTKKEPAKTTAPESKAKVEIPYVKPGETDKLLKDLLTPNPDGDGYDKHALSELLKRPDLSVNDAVKVQFAISSGLDPVMMADPRLNINITPEPLVPGQVEFDQFRGVHAVNIGELIASAKSHVKRLATERGYAFK